MLDRVLGRDHDERGAQGVRLGVDRDLPLLHALQQRGLGLGRRAIDLVAEDDVGEDGAGLELEVTRLLAEHVDPGDIGREQVRGELDPSERAVDRPGDRLREHRLADAGHVLDQQVAFGDERHEREPDLLVLAPDDPLDVLFDLAESSRERPRIRKLLSYFHQHPTPEFGDRCTILRPRGELGCPEVTRRIAGDGKFPTAAERSDATRAGRPTNGRPERPLFATIRHRARADPPSSGRLHGCDSPVRIPRGSCEVATLRAWDAPSC